MAHLINKNAQNIYCPLSYIFLVAAANKIFFLKYLAVADASRKFKDINSQLRRHIAESECAEKIHFEKWMHSGGFRPSL